MAKTKIQKPLLYIQQPYFDNHAANMQQYFITKKMDQQVVPEKNTIIEELQELAKADAPEHNQKIEAEVLQETTTLKEPEPNVMNFMLEEILTSKEELELTQEPPQIIPSQTIPIKKLHSPTKSNTRTPFNELTLPNKLIQIRKLSVDVVKFLFEFITVDETYKGYFILLKDGNIMIKLSDDAEPITIPVNRILDLNIIGF